MFFFFNDTATTEIYTLSLHDALPILPDYSKLGDTYVGDCHALNGPFEFRIIEWILLPSKHGYRPYDKAPMNDIHQNLDEVRMKIDASGHYEYEMVEDGLKIYGYKP